MPAEPVSHETLTKYCDEICGDVVGDNEYDHEASTKWNGAIIEKLLAKLREETKSYKFITYATLIDTSAAGPSGIRTSSGSYLNPEKDGVWNYKWDKGSNVSAIISVAWIYSTQA
ncbi:hypothetical protein TRICI_004665 [Trichomonascus ciferrii]|uniref:Topoisomerase I damage affected protein 2 n=1 Tax=Trichomonascus ciferrii TaxID=44093 RepID=A0A642V6M8_9ASCO|nr:hypothetical protein TRICI_004665 [Trichomonascus ciferrii]